MHFTTAILAALPFLAAAAPTPSGASATVPSGTTGAYSTATASSSPYYVMALRSGSPIHFLQLNAANSTFWLGGATSSYCPLAADACPPGNATVFDAANLLSTEVPGGQEIFVAPSGALGFTPAHTNYKPAGSVVNPIVFTPETGTFTGDISTSAFGATGFMACPTTTNNWEVFAAINNATVPTGNIADCLGFDAVTVAWTGPTPEAWQYV